jgi:hypothetical protein
MLLILNKRQNIQINVNMQYGATRKIVTMNKNLFSIAY